MLVSTLPDFRDSACYPVMMVEDPYLSLGDGGSVSCPLGISERALISWQDGSQGVPSTGVDCHGSGLGWQNKVTSD